MRLGFLCLTIKMRLGFLCFTIKMRLGFLGLTQTLTRASISRNSRREMIQIFLSRSREANFHVSFSSRFSRIGGKVSLSPLDFQDLKIISLSFLDPFLFLLSTFKNLEKISLSPLDFQDFLNQHFDNWSLSMICQNMLLSLYHLTTFTFTQLPDWFLTSSWHCVRQRLQKGKVFTTLIFCRVPHHLFSFKQLLMETTKRKEMEGRTKRGCSCTWTIWRMMIATRRTRLVRISFSEDKK